MSRPMDTGTPQDSTDVTSPSPQQVAGGVSLRRPTGPLHEEHLRLAGHNVLVTQDNLGVVELHLE